MCGSDCTKINRVKTEQTLSYIYLFIVASSGSCYNNLHLKMCVNNEVARQPGMPSEFTLISVMSKELRWRF